MSVPNAPPAKANARKSAVFLVPRTCHPSFPLVANSDRDGTAPIFYTERKSIVSKERGKSVNCRRDGIRRLTKRALKDGQRYRRAATTTGKSDPTDCPDLKALTLFLCYFLTQGTRPYRAGHWTAPL